MRRDTGRQITATVTLGSDPTDGPAAAEPQASARSAAEGRPPEGDVERAQGFIERSDGARLFFTEWAPRAAATGGEPAGGGLVIAMHGFGEHSGRYDEFAQFLVERGYVVARLDARGHGQSSGPRGHVREFDEYVDDLAAFVRELVQRRPDLPLALFGHSNGGLTAIRAVQRGLVQPEGLVLTSPLLRVRKRPVPDVVARWLSRLVPALPLPSGIRSRDLTHDLELQAAHARDRRVHGVATPGWYWSMTTAQRQALAAAPDLTLPVLVLCAELDALVDPAATLEFHAALGSTDKELELRRGEFHEVLNEVNRRQAYERIGTWLRRVLATRSPARR